MQQVITIFHIIIAVFVILLVLIQRGKGADMGAGFGSGASGTVFGSQGSTPFLVKLTAGLALLFFVSSSILSLVVGKETARPNELPFATAPMKTIETIPVASDIDTKQAASAVPVAPVVSTNKMDKTSTEVPGQKSTIIKSTHKTEKSTHSHTVHEKKTEKSQ